MHASVARKVARRKIVIHWYVLRSALWLREPPPALPIRADLALFHPRRGSGHGEAVKRITAICAAASYVLCSVMNKRTARSWSQGAGIVSEDMVWRVALLSVVFLTDIIVFIGLCRDEIRDWRGRRSVRLSPRAANENYPALAARRAAR